MENNSNAFVQTTKCIDSHLKRGIKSVQNVVADCNILHRNLHQRDKKGTVLFLVQLQNVLCTSLNDLPRYMLPISQQYLNEDYMAIKSSFSTGNWICIFTTLFSKES